jgi:hypothetical protein
MHPLAPDLSGLSDVELNKKLAEMQTKLSQAYRFGNGQLVYQLQMLMEDYQAESSRRQQKQFEELMEKNNSKFDNLINVKK